MVKYVMMMVMAAALAVDRTAGDTAPATVARAEYAGAVAGIVPLDKTWTTWGQENAAGPQVLVAAALTSPVSFQAEGTGLEPATPLLGHHISSYARRLSTDVY
jgi:hypothetical protein